MIFAWNPQPVFRSRVLVLGFILAARAAFAVGSPEVVWTDENPASAKEMSWLHEDRGWLRSLPEGYFSPSLPDPFSSGADSVDFLRKWVERTAGQDSLPRLRSVHSLLRDRWLDRGYFEARVTGQDTLFLASGSRYHWGEWSVGGEEFSGRQHLLETWLPRPGKSFDRRELEHAIEMLLLGAGEAGHPFARWITQDLELARDSFTVTLKGRLLVGHLAVIGPISSNLSTQRASNFLARATGLKHGALLRHSDLLRASDRLLARDLYSSVGTPQVYLTSDKDTVGVHFPVTERRKINRFQVVLGLSRKQEGEPSRVSGEVDLRLPNMAGTGRRLGIGWRDDGKEKSWFGFSYLEPLAFGTPLDTEFILDNEVQSGSHTRFRLDNRWRIPVVALWGAELGVGWDRSTFPTGTLVHSSRLRGRGGILHHRGDRSRSGWSGLFSLETAYRSSTLRPEDDQTEAPSPQLGEALTQRIFSGDLSGEWWVTQTISFFNRASYRQISGGDAEVPLSEQFRFGGAATLRGYREDEFHGTAASWGSLEVRIGRPGGSRLYTFYDLGYFEFSVLDPLGDDPDHRSLKKGWPRGYGLGILARTPGGDISLAIGFPGTVDFEQAKLHVTLLESF